MESSSRGCSNIARVMWLVLLLGMLWPLASAQAQEPTAPKKMVLPIGATKVVTIPWVRDVQVSRRGTIYLRHIKDDTWEITALRSGLVMVAGDDPSQSSPLFVEVLPKSPAQKSHLNVSAMRTTPSVGLPDSKEILLRAFVTLAEDSTSEKNGVRGTPSVSYRLNSSGPALSWAPDFAPFSVAKAMQTIAAPIFNISTGTTASAHSGGEFRVQFTTDKGSDAKREGWKEHGFRLSVTPESVSADEISVSYEMTLKTMMSVDNDPHLSTNELTGTVTLKRHMTAVAGTLNLSGSASGSRGALAGIPIIGPLFTDRSRDQASKHLILWFLFEDPQDLVQSLGAPPATTPPKGPN